MAKLDIAERRKPQDGKIQMQVNNKEIDIRVSAYPTTYGENVVMRILDRTNSILDLHELGFSKKLHSDFTKLLHVPYGIILVTGPTGAGKTTTLYAALQEINSVDKNIMTIEDPIEYQIPMIRQSQVNIKAGLTFANGLRSLLRQDPDVMLIGEVRDQETAEIAVESALTGHLVFATLHTNDSVGAITRLREMGIENFLISSSLIGVVAQRLIRTICHDCKKAVPAGECHLSEDEIKTLNRLRENQQDELKTSVKEPLILYQGQGCATCKNTGYKGRMSIYELLTVNDSIREMMARRTSTAEFREKCFDDKNLTMRLYGYLKVLQGMTTVEEVLKAVNRD
jgi:type II secretory ATPase GspE/PulE/Tfp pilus assembly ATPase PilB-like protein